MTDIRTPILNSAASAQSHTDSQPGDDAGRRPSERATVYVVAPLTARIFVMYDTRRPGLHVDVRNG